MPSLKKCLNSHRLHSFHLKNHTNIVKYFRNINIIIDEKTPNNDKIMIKTSSQKGSIAYLRAKK